MTMVCNISDKLSLNLMPSAANDNRNLWSFEELVKLNIWSIGRKMLVPAKTYRSRSGYYSYMDATIDAAKRSIGHMGVNYDNGDFPVPMKGCWEFLTETRRPYRDFVQNVVRRYISRYKLNILSHDSSVKLAHHLDALIWRTDKAKRYGYHNTNIKKGFYTYRNCGADDAYCVVMGRYEILSKDKIKAIKSILRQKTKLEKLINHNKDSEKWQRLIQQAI